MNLSYIIFVHFKPLHLIMIKFRTIKMNCHFEAWGKRPGDLVGGKGPGFKRPWGEKAGVQMAGGNSPATE